MNILNKIKRVGMGVGLAGLLVANNGCETPQEGALGGALLGALGAAAGNPGAQFFGGAMVSSANAEMSRSQVNVNVNQPAQIRRQGTIYFYVGYWVDGLNGNPKNGQPEIPGEIIETNRVYCPPQNPAAFMHNPDENTIQPMTKVVLKDLDKNTKSEAHHIIGPSGSIGHYFKGPDDVEYIDGTPIRSFLAEMYIAFDGIRDFRLLDAKPFQVIKNERPNINLIFDPLNENK